MPSKSQLTYLSGKVVADDGGQIENAEITVRCEGEAIQVAHPDTDGVLRFALGSEVIRITEKALLLDPLHSARMWLLRCIAQYTQKDINGAMESANRGLSNDKQHRFPRLELVDAQILLDKRDLPGALSHLQNYLQINPRASDTEEIRQKMKQIAAIVDGKDSQNALQ